MPSAFVAGTAPQSVSSLTTPSTSSTTSNPTGVDPNMFLKLLTTELQNQDPTQPQDPTQSVSQLAQFSALQYQQQLASAFSAFQSNFGIMQAASLIGKTATVNVGSSTNASGNGSTVTGTINSITVQNGQPYFTMTDSSGKVYTDNNGNPLLFSTSEITGIGTATVGTGTGTGTGTGVGNGPTTNSPSSPGTGLTPGG